MSWQNYVDVQIIGAACATDGLIAGHDGTVWATSPDMSGKIKPDEVKKLVAAYADPSDLHINGARLGGEKYHVMAVKPDLHWIHLKKGASSAHVIKTTQTLLFAFNDGRNESVNERNISKVIQDLGDYLRGVGY